MGNILFKKRFISEKIVLNIDDDEVEGYEVEKGARVCLDLFMIFIGDPLKRNLFDL